MLYKSYEGWSQHGTCTPQHQKKPDELEVDRLDLIPHLKSEIDQETSCLSVQPILTPNTTILQAICIQNHLALKKKTKKVKIIHTISWKDNEYNHLLCLLMIARTSHVRQSCSKWLNLPHELISNSTIVLLLKKKMTARSMEFSREKKDAGHWGHADTQYKKN